MMFVDPIQYHRTTLRYKHWCHLVSDKDEAELHEFAARLGLRRSWAQLRPEHSAAHYDLVPNKRTQAILMGAQAVSSKQLVLSNYDGLYRRGLLDLHPNQIKEYGLEKYKVEAVRCASCGYKIYQCMCNDGAAYPF